MSTTLPAPHRASHGLGDHDLHDEVERLGQARSAFDFRYIVAAIRANLWLIAAIVAAALAVALVATWMQTKRYDAVVSIQINDSSGRVLGSKEDQPDEMNEAGWDIDRFLKTQTEIISSRGMALRVAQKLSLLGNPVLYQAQGLQPPAAGTSAENLKMQAAGLLAGHLSVKLPRDSRIVKISYNSTNPAFSAQVANAYASEFIDSNLDRKFDSSAYARNFLGEQLTEAKTKLEKSERDLNDYARSAGIIRIATSEGPDGKSGGNGSVIGASLQQLNNAANEATAARIQAEGRWRAVSGGSLMSAPAVLANPTVVSLLNQKASVEADLAQDRSRHLEDYPSVRAKQSQLDVINRQLQVAANNVRASVRSEYDAALATERQLQAQVSRLKGETMSEQDRSVQYNLLSREVDTNRQLYDGLLERFKTLNAIAGVSLSNVSMIDAAEVPRGPSSPNLFNNLLAGLVIGLGLAALVVFFKDQFDDAIRVPEDIEAKLNLALLGVVPQTRDDDPDNAMRDPKSPVSEAYNSLRGSLMYSTPEGLPQIMLVTSAQAAEGKTTTAIAIAQGFARMGKSVLLVDADMRRPSLHRRLGLIGEHGLSTLLTSHDPLSSALVKAEGSKLAVLIAGPVPPSPTELLSTARIEEILQEAAGQFDVIVVDSPPILGLADAPMLAALADGVVFVVEADRSRRGALKTALRRLRAMRPVILGALLTKFDPLKSGNRYSEYYGYHYYQYESRAEKG
ncbi:MAG: polysaccharide biosynthesis tyrosine autokinase [Novosphingobium sp.]|uniref:GumC family protein n=1 Tax=Novosphingobium sp. TaxID=1874826 RepID=UPI0032BC2BEA